MAAAQPSFADLWDAWPWRTIRGCPGRFSWGGDDPRLPVTAFAGEDNVERYEVPAARDPVLVVELKDGGIISYARADGTFLHTLNTPLGFHRKLGQLGIVRPIKD